MLFYSQSILPVTYIFVNCLLNLTITRFKAANFAYLKGENLFFCRKLNQNESLYEKLICRIKKNMLYYIVAFHILKVQQPKHPEVL